MAERGEIVAVAIAGIGPNGFTRTRAIRGSRGMGEIIGAVAVMQYDLIKMWKDD